MFFTMLAVDLLPVKPLQELLGLGRTLPGIFRLEFRGGAILVGIVVHAIGIADHKDAVLGLRIAIMFVTYRANRKGIPAVVNRRRQRVQRISKRIYCQESGQSQDHRHKPITTQLHIKTSLLIYPRQRRKAKEVCIKMFKKCVFRGFF